jgi:hypothetical protein
VFDEIKIHQLDSRPVLRSREPEEWSRRSGASSCSTTVRDLIHTSARDAGVDPDRVSFTCALRAARRQVADQAGLSPSGLRRAVSAVAAELVERLNTRRRRDNPHVVRRTHPHPVSRQEADRPSPGAASARCGQHRSQTLSPDPWMIS